VNPGLQIGDTNYNATAGQHRWVKVYDAISGFNGFIDPNSPAFAVYSTDRPEEFADIGESNPAYGPRLGPPVYTSKVALAPTVITLTAGAFSYDFAANPATFYTTSLLGAGAAVTLTASTVPSAGTMIYLRILGNALGTNAITLSTNFKANALATPLAIPGANQYLTLQFISDGTSLVESGARVLTS
jgi:hypothetical protein